MKEGAVHLLSVAVAMAVIAASSIAQGDEIISLNEFLVADKLPEGFVSSTSDTNRDGKVVGQVITVAHPNQSRRVTILCEFVDVPDVESRQTATRTRFQSYAASLVKLGYKTVDKNIPDFDQQTFEKPLSMTVHFFNDERKLWTHHVFFFTDKSYWVRATADSIESLEDLKKWALTVKPKPQN